MKDCGFKSAFEVVHGKEPDVTFFSRIKSPYAAREPPACFDYIFYQGDGLEPASAVVTADQCVPGDPSIYASDHMAIYSDFKL